MRKYLLLIALGVTLLAGTSPWSRLVQTTNCQNVSTTAVEVLALDNTRIRWSIWTTSGSATIYFREDGTAVARASHSGPLVAGASYTEDMASVTKAVSAITSSGTTWVCTKSAVNP